LGAITAGPLEANAEASGGLGEGDRFGVGLGVVGQDPLDPHPVVGEEPSRLDQEAGGGGGLLIGQDLAEGDPGTVIDSRVNVVIADAASTIASSSAVDAVAATVRGCGPAS
jgi:hypothetical protein